MLSVALGAAHTARGAEPPAPPPSPAARIGVVDVDRLLEALQGWQDTQARLSEEEKTGRKSLEELEKEVNRVRAELAYFKPGSRDHEERMAQLALRQQQLARQTDQIYRQMDQRSKAALEAARAQIAVAVREYAAANAFDVVVDARAALYVAGGSDITLEVARVMNKRYKDELKTKETKPPEAK